MRFRVPLTALALAGLIPLGLVADAKTSNQDDKLDKKVIEIVKETGNLYKLAKSLRADATFVSQAEGQDKENTVTAVYEVEKPKFLSLKTQVGGSNKKGPDVIADGKNVIIFRKALDQYMEVEAPKTLAEVGLQMLQLGPANAGMLFANILADDPAELLMDGVNSCSYVGKAKVDDTPVHHMKFSQDAFDWELFVAAEGKPYILRMISTIQGQNGKVKTTETYKNWKLDATPAKDTFKFTPPAGAKKVNEFDQN